MQAGEHGTTLPARIEQPTAKHYLNLLAAHSLCCAHCHRYLNHDARLDTAYESAPCSKGKAYMLRAFAFWQAEPETAVIQPEPAESMLDMLHQRATLRYYGSTLEPADEQARRLRG